jgi:DNA-binding CsgD family transcriptional regulator
MTEGSEVALLLKGLRELLQKPAVQGYERVAALESALRRAAPWIERLWKQQHGLAWLAESQLENPHVLATEQEILWSNQAAESAFARHLGLRPLVQEWTRQCLLPVQRERRTAPRSVRHLLDRSSWVRGQTQVLEPGDERALVAVRFSLGTRVEPSRALTPAEDRVLSELVTGATNKEIACKLDVSVETIRTQVQGILKKLGVGTRVKAALWARER